MNAEETIEALVAWVCRLTGLPASVVRLTVGLPLMREDS